MEAGKCFALHRYTAVVFHLMRMLEIGIAGVARCLSIPDPTKPSLQNWGTILQAIKNEMVKQTKETEWNDPGDKRFFEDVYASLDAVRNAWRNAAMHVENKYTEEEADTIYRAVRSFMRKLASRLDEQGAASCLRPGRQGRLRTSIDSWFSARVRCCGCAIRGYRKHSQGMTSTGRVIWV